MTQGLAPSTGNISAAPSGRIQLTRLTLTNFRNYPHLRFECDGPAVVLVGENGAGKTNILEAVSFLVPGSGLRGAKISTVGTSGGIGNAGAPTRWAVAAKISGSSATNIGTGLEPSAPGGRDTGSARERRSVRIDGEPARTQSVLAEHFSCHWLTPQMDRLFQGGAETRRRFLDRIVFSIDPAHAGRTSAYMHAMRERSRLLREGRGDDAWLSALEETMATKGVAVAAARLDIQHRLGDICEAHSAPFPAARISALGVGEQMLEKHPALEVEEHICQILKASRAIDGQKGGAGGASDERLPHQSDLAVIHVPNNRPAGDCSTGEQKMLLTALVLAAARMAAMDEGRAPVLLLDEAAAHLDTRHLGALFDAVADIGAQAWFTGTDENLYAALKPHALFARISNGGIVPT